MPQEAELVEILDAGERIARYIAGLDELGFIDNLLVVDAVCLNLVRIGEAANLLTQESTALEPSISWRRITDMRNRIAHGYAGLDIGVVWTAASVGVPELVQAVRRMLREA